VIPSLIHFVWIGPPRPAWVQENIGGFQRLNPDYRVIVHNESELVEPFRRRYVETDDLCTKADLVALSVMRTQGGFYFDTDFVPLRSLSDLRYAWMLDGQTMFVARQHGQRDKSLKIACGVMAASTEWRGWPLFEEHVAAARPPHSRTRFGPEMFTHFEAMHPELFTVGAWPWFFPLPIATAAVMHRYAAQHGLTSLRLVAPTGGQLPYMLHLWAHGKPDLLVPGKENKA